MKDNISLRFIAEDRPSKLKLEWAGGSTYLSGIFVCMCVCVYV